MSYTPDLLITRPRSRSIITSTTGMSIIILSIPSNTLRHLTVIAYNFRSRFRRPSIALAQPYKRHHFSNTEHNVRQARVRLHLHRQTCNTMIIVPFRPFNRRINMSTRLRHSNVPLFRKKFRMIFRHLAMPIRHLIQVTIPLMFLRTLLRHSIFLHTSLHRNHNHMVRSFRILIRANLKRRVNMLTKVLIGGKRRRVAALP